MSSDQSAPFGQLYIVSTPIGNPDDITLRALAVLQTADLVVCEERRYAQKLLGYYDIEKELIELNEHNDADATIECVKLLGAGKKLALISDAGTPVLADPGGLLVAAAIRYGYAVHVIPGPSSITAALVRSGLPTDQFLYAGFLSRKKEEREQQARLLALEPRTIVLLDTPYRLNTVLSTLADVMPERRAYIGCNLTMPSESHHYGSLTELRDYFAQNRFRGEYAIVIEGNPSVKQWYEQLNAATSLHTANGAQLQKDVNSLPEQSVADEQVSDAQSERYHQTRQQRTHRYHGNNRRRFRPHYHKHHSHQREERRPSRPNTHEGSRYDYEQPIINYTLSNPYQQHTHPSKEHRPSHQTRRPKKRWRR